jgi:hypothetical protein
LIRLAKKETLVQFKKLLHVALFVALFALTAHADPIQLTGGQVVMIDPCDDPFGSVNLTGTGGFVVSGTGANSGCVSGNGFTFAFEQGGATSQLAYQGQTYTYFRGGVFFNNDTITGSVTAYDTNFFLNPLATFTFSGNGFRADHPSSFGTVYVFNVTSTPEPASALLLLTGVTAAAGFVRRRRRGEAS